MSDDKQPTPSEDLFPTSDQESRSLAPVTVRARYVWAERNRRLLEANLAEKEDLHIGGVSRGLGDPSSDRNNYVPEEVFGYAIRHKDIRTKADNGATYSTKKSYLSPFHESVISNLTTSRKIHHDGVPGYEGELLPSPAKISTFVNKSIFTKRVTFPEDFQYVYRDGLSLGDAVETYRMVAKIVSLSSLNIETSTPHVSRCLLCWEPREGYCDDCEVKVTTIGLTAPIECLFPVVKSAHKIIPTEASNKIAAATRIILRDFAPEKKAWSIAPSFSLLYGDEADFAETIKEYSDEPPLEPLRTYHEILAETNHKEEE